MAMLLYMAEAVAAWMAMLKQLLMLQVVKGVMAEEAIDILAAALQDKEMQEPLVLAAAAALV
jgi:hypothetical protein